MANPWDNDPEIKAGPWDNDPEVAAAQDKPLWQRATDPLRYGTAETLRGDASTLKLAAGKDSNVAHLLEGGANLVAPQDYEPAGDAMQKAWDQGKYLAWASNLPKRVGESLPQLGQAVAGGAVAGPLGFGAGYMGSTVGPDANMAASARTGDMGAEPNTGDVARAVASGAANALIQRATLGLAKGIPVSVASSAGVRAAAGQVAKGAAAEAAGSGAGSIAHQAIVEQKLPDVQETLADTATGGLLGAGIRAAKVPADAVNSVKASRAGLTGEEGQRIADRLAPEDMSTPTKAFAAVKKVETDLKAQFSANKPKGQPDAVDEVINRTKSTLDQGGQVDPSDLMSLKSTFGANDPFVNAIEDHSSLNQVKTLGNFDTGGETFAGGITGSPFGKLALNPLGKYGRMGEVGNFAAHALGFHVPGIGHALGALSPETGLAIAAGHTGLYGAAHAGDRLLGLRNPGQEFVNRFASPEGQGFDPSQLPPSYNDQQSSQAAQVAAANDKLKNLGKTAAIMQRSQALEQAQANAPLAEAKRTSQLMTNSDALAARQANDALKSPAFTSKMMTADAANQAKAQALLENTVKTAEAAKQQKINAALAAAKFSSSVMKNSDPAKTSAGDATMPLRVARLKQQFAAQAERDSEAAIKQQVSEARAQKREETKAGLQSLLEGDNAEAKFQARVAELGAKRKAAAPQPKQQAEQPQPDVMPPHPTMRVEEGGHAVDRTTAGVLKAARYAESIRGRMAAKNDAINASIAENPAHATALTSLLTELHTGNARSRNGAEAVIQRHLQNLPPSVQASVRKHLTEKFWNAWRKVND